MERKNLVVSVFGLEFDYWNYYGQQLTQIYLLMSLVCLHLFAISVRPSRNNSLTSVFTFWLYQKSCRLNVKVLFSTIFSKMYLHQNKYLRLNQKVQIAHLHQEVCKLLFSSSAVTFPASTRIIFTSFHLLISGLFWNFIKTEEKVLTKSAFLTKSV